MLTRKDFPEGFLFGAATAAYQVEGASFGGCGPCHWDTFAATPGNVVRAEDGAVACDQYHRYAEDMDLLASGNFDAYRFSTSWARVLPEGRGTPNAEGLDYYDRLVDKILERGMKPFQTLYHWEMPSALADLGGWTNRDVASWFADFSEVITDRIGDRVASIATINEPWCVTWLSHFLGIHAPGKRDIRAAARAMHHVLLAHGAAVERLRGMGQKNLGIVLNFEHCLPATEGEDAATARADAINNRWFIEAITRQQYPAEAMEGLAPHLPTGWDADMPRIGAPLDWLGINYYTRALYSEAPGTPWPSFNRTVGEKPQTQMGWEIHPEGLHHILMRMQQETGGLPLYITENGMANADEVLNGTVNDPVREDFVDAHLEAVRQAISDGADVRGFFYWSLLDNYEWAEGYEKRFGLVHVDFETLERTPKSSFRRLARMLERV